MRIISTSFKFLRSKSLPVIAAVLLYLLPNLVQDVHRVFGHSNIFYSTQASTGKNIHQSFEKCTVCVFEFYSVDEIHAPVFNVLLAICNTVFTDNISHQLTSKVFDYSQLRAPPVS